MDERLGVVVIGRNEGTRLGRCLESVKQGAGWVVYVDSHSVDGSVTLARHQGVEAVELDASSQFTASRGRNAGSKILGERLPGLEFIQFVDGDCELRSGWLETALSYLERHGDVAAVSGRLRERDRSKNIYHRLADLEWDGPPGESEYCGGIAMFRADAFRAAGGFDESLAAGEEPELCLRLRRQGGRVMRLADEMALHDIAMSRFSEWWSRTVRGGRAYAECAWLHGLSVDRYRIRHVISIFFWGALVPFAAVGTAWYTSGLSLALIGLYAVLWARVRSERLDRGDSREDASLYAVACVVAKFAQMIGLAQVAWNRARERSWPGPKISERLGRRGGERK